MTTRKRTGLRIPFEKNTKLNELANEIGVSKNALILQAIDEYLRKIKRQNETAQRKGRLQ